MTDNSNIIGRYIRNRETGDIHKVIAVTAPMEALAPGVRDIQAQAVYLTKRGRHVKVTLSRITEGHGRKNAYQLLPECFTPKMTTI